MIFACMRMIIIMIFQLMLIQLILDNMINN